MTHYYYSEGLRRCQRGQHWILPTPENTIRGKDGAILCKIHRYKLRNSPKNKRNRDEYRKWQLKNKS